MECIYSQGCLRSQSDSGAHAHDTLSSLVSHNVLDGGVDVADRGFHRERGGKLLLLSNNDGAAGVEGVASIDDIWGQVHLQCANDGNLGSKAGGNGGGLNSGNQHGAQVHCGSITDVAVVHIATFDSRPYGQRSTSAIA